MTPERYAAWLLHGEIPIEDAPELDNHEFRFELERRLSRCGLALHRGRRWMALCRDATPVDGGHPTWALRVDETIVLLQFRALVERNAKPSCSSPQLLDAGTRAGISRERLERFILPAILRRGLLIMAAGELSRGPRFAVVDSEAIRDRLLGIDVLVGDGL